MGCRITDHKGEWFNIWMEDKESMISIMIDNMISDIDAGYDPDGHSIRRQVVDIEEYQIEYDHQMNRFKYMEDNAVDRWCFYDLKKRGAIA